MVFLAHAHQKYLFGRAVNTRNHSLTPIAEIEHCQLYRSTYHTGDYMLGNPMLDSVNHGGGPAGDADLVVDMLQVVLDCFPADDQGLCDLGVTLTPG